MSSANLRFLYAGASLSLMIRLFGVGLLFLANIVLARSISQHEYGLFAYSIEVIALVSVVAALGFDQIAIRVVPDCLAEGDRAGLRRFLACGLAIVAVASTCAVLALHAARNAGALPSGMGSGLIALTGLAIAALSALRVAQETMRASRRIALSQVVEQVGWPALLLLLGAAIALGVGGGALTVDLLLGAQAAFYGAATLMLLFLIARQVPANGPRSVDEGPRQWLATGIPLALAASLSILLNRGDILALGSAVTAAELAPYTAASRYAALLVLGLAAASAAGAAGMRDAWRTGDRDELQHLIDRTAGLSIAFALPIGAGLIALPELALSLYGPGYVEGSTALRILAAAQIVNAFTGPVALVVIICDLGKTYTAAMAGSVALLAALLAGLIPAFGTLGAAVATLIALSALNVILAIAIRQRTGLRAWATPASMVSALSDIAAMVRRR